MHSESSGPEFVRRQTAFAAHIRDPGNAPRPADVDERRMAVYRELIYNNLEGLLASNFPVLRSLLADAHWHGMVRDFLVRHRCRTPLFAEVAQEFLDYLCNEREQHPEDPPFLRELAHYEWVELAVAVSDADSDTTGVDPAGDLLEGVPVVTPVAWNLSYRYPVHRLSRDYQPREAPAEPTHLVVYRDRTDAVRFLEINVVTQRLLGLLKENRTRRGLDILTAVAGELRSPAPATVVRAGSEVLANLRERDILLGTRTA